MSKTLTTTQFIEKAMKFHPTLDYSKVIYTGSQNKIIIICPLHGEFTKKPDQFLLSHGCKQCGFDKRTAKLAFKQEDFIKKCVFIFPEYDCSVVKYVDLHTHVNIICPKHGNFSIKPARVTGGKKGCPKCVKERVASTQRLTTEQFITRATEKHGDRYDYSKVIYTGTANRVEIICSAHGNFWQFPQTHISSSGCLACVGLDSFSRSGWRSKCNGRVSYVYIILVKSIEETFIKIGISINKEGRYKNYIEKGFEVEELGYMKFESPDDSFNMEHILFKALTEYKYKPLVKFSGSTECFQNRSEVLSTFNLLSPKG